LKADVQVCPTSPPFFRKKGGGLARCPGCPTFSLLFFPLTHHKIYRQYSHFLPGIKYRDILDILDISTPLPSFCERRVENLDMLGHMPSNPLFLKKEGVEKFSEIKREPFFPQTLLSPALFGKGRF